MLGALAVLSFVVALVAVRVLISPLGRFALDQPNERSLHERPVPRTGGIGVLVGASVSTAFGVFSLWLPMALALGLAVVSLVDDLYDIPVGARLLAHLAAAGVLAWYTLSPMHPGSLALLLLAVAWITNLFNFMDGSDGLAGGMSTIGFGAYAIGAHLGGDPSLAALSAALAGAAGGFLVYNFHPARIFLGDVGSIPLGFLAAALGIVGWRNDLWPLWFPVLVFAPFIGDATITLLKRAFAGRRVWQAHREHYYQRMVRMGLGHRRTAYVGYAAMLLCAAAALFGRHQPAGMQAAVLFGTAGVLAALAVWLDLLWARFLRQPPEPA